MVQNSVTWFALDNIDFLEDTASGKNTSHGIAIAMYQNEEPSTRKKPLSLQRPPNKSETDKNVDIKSPVLQQNRHKTEKEI